MFWFAAKLKEPSLLWVERRRLQETEGKKSDQPGFQLAVGARLVFSDDTPDILAYPRDRAAWGRLTRLLSLGKRRADKGDCILGLPDLLDHLQGLNLVVMPPSRLHRLGALLDRLLGS